MAATLETTATPGIFRRHRKGCAGSDRCGCSYVVVWRHRGKQHKATFRTYGEAREAKGQRDAGDRRPRGRVRFGDYFDDWIVSYAGRTARGFSETTRPEYRRPIEAHALKRWASWYLDDIGAGDVRALFASMREAGVSTAGIRKLRAALSALFATAVEDEAARSNPVQGVRIPQLPADEPVDRDEASKALTRSELALLLAALPAEWRLFFEFLAHSGLRISETIGLRWEHVDLGKTPQILVREQYYRGKRRKLKSKYGRRDIPLSAGMAKKLAAHRRDTYRGDSSVVFGSTVGTELHGSNVQRRVLAPAAIAVGLYVEVEVDGETQKRSSVGFHTFRHTCASLLFDGGKNVKQVQEWLGHSDPGFTLRTYVHLMDDGLGAADFLDEAVMVAGEQRQGNTGATGDPQADANERASATVETAS